MDEGNTIVPGWLASAGEKYLACGLSGLAVNALVTAVLLYLFNCKLHR